MESGGNGKSVWLIEANQGHSFKTMQVELESTLQSVSDTPSGLAIHGRRVVHRLFSRERVSRK
ncbi:hypothetical protein P691DRAFT_809280 [Macrolepiota fuliginosa MF-IS2]|uniref:Uncharacterized protein n=1 Tax=Macrolepiota fuliginosa MF-IS2 TaxID=1400762 RepID=A0A9P5X4I5_9AGAR|nr:hypothetical protein P691DRAFT_809280 [Macrolepiota fuliginosa MF-IS2]